MRYRLMTYTRRCVCAREREKEKPNGVYFEIRKKKSKGEKLPKKSKIESCSFAILYTKKNENNFVDDNRLFFFFSRTIFFLHILKIDI